jgi:transcriptional regulator with XRE-family HTH domain
MHGDRLRWIREQRGFTQEELAEQLGIGAKEIWRYENNKTKPSGETVAEIAKFFGITADFLLGLTEAPVSELQQSDLKPQERAVIAAWRRGARIEAIKVIVEDE